MSVLVTQEMLKADILRRCRELLLLGWLGRAYLIAPLVVDALSPSVFGLTPYSAAAAPCFEDVAAGVRVCTLRESSVGGVKGIPFTLRFERGTGSTDYRVELLGIGCDLSHTLTAQAAGEARQQMDDADVQVPPCLR